MTIPAADSTVPSLWLTSRTVFERGFFCPMARWIEYAAGPFGYGYQRRALSLPLVTGSYVHEGCTEICRWLMEARLSTGVQPPDAPNELIRWAANLMVQKYRTVVEQRGILALQPEDSKPALERVISEQTTLIEGLIWAWAAWRLPVILDEYLIVQIEEEEEYVLGCTCGLGDGIGGFGDHARRSCGGIGLQSKPDLLLERKVDHAYCYTELKTSGTAKRAWADSWERKQQLIVGVLGAEKRHGIAITHCRIEGLIKGQRKSDYPYTDPMTGKALPKTQQSNLVYGYYEPPDPPMSIGDWRPAHTYYDRDNVKHTVPKGRNNHYSRTGIWEPPAEEAFPGRPPDMSPVEYWVKYLATQYPFHVSKSLHAIGPLPKQTSMVDKAIRSFIAEERLWQDRLWRVYEWQTANNGKGWGDPDYHQFVETVIPRSWNCDPFGPDHPCPNQPICHEQVSAWREPIESQLFVYRAPHHAAERAQQIARGLTSVEGLGEDPDEHEGDSDDD